MQERADGVNREQAVCYQQFELDLLLLAVLAARAHGARFSPAVERRIRAMLEFIAGIMDAGGNVPAIGDSDDGCVVRLAPGPGLCRFRSLLAAGAQSRPNRMIAQPIGKRLYGQLNIVTIDAKARQGPTGF